MDDIVVFAVDPGISGGGAFVNGRGLLLDCFDLPTIGEGTSRRIDAANLALIIRTINPTRAVVELVSSRPGQGLSSTFKFGEATGTVVGILGCLQIPIQRVSAAKWKGALRLSSDKEASRQRAIETWPESARDFAKKRDHNRAEAALLALYAVRGGGAG